MPGRGAWASGAGQRAARAWAEGAVWTVGTARGLAGTPGEVAGPPAVPVLTEVPGFGSRFPSGFAWPLPTQVCQEQQSRSPTQRRPPQHLPWVSPPKPSHLPLAPLMCREHQLAPGSERDPQGCAAAHPSPAPALGSTGTGTEASSALARMTGRGPVWPGVRRVLRAQGPGSRLGALPLRRHLDKQADGRCQRGQRAICAARPPHHARTATS